MGRIDYVKGDLFSVPRGVLAHACNCHGVWGGGIALQFRRRFPRAHAAYAAHCRGRAPAELLGTAFVADEGPHAVACLFTSEGSTHAEVAQHTRAAVADLARQLPAGTRIHMPQINAGIFAVPWEVTERALAAVDAPITVYTLA